jgi:hypothetical protein
MILDDIQLARDHGKLRHAAMLKLALRHFASTHPAAH